MPNSQDNVFLLWSHDFKLKYAKRMLASLLQYTKLPLLFLFSFQWPLLDFAASYLLLKLGNGSREKRKKKETGLAGALYKATCCACRPVFPTPVTASQVQEQCFLRCDRCTQTTLSNQNSLSGKPATCKVPYQHKQLRIFAQDAKKNVLSPAVISQISRAPKITSDPLQSGHCAVTQTLSESSAPPHLASHEVDTKNCKSDAKCHQPFPSFPKRIPRHWCGSPTTRAAQ